MDIKDTKEFDEKFGDSFRGGDMNSFESAEPIKEWIIQDRTKLIKSLIPEEDFYSFYICASVDLEGYWEKVDNFEDIPEHLRDTPGCWRKHYYDDSYKHKFLEILEEELSKLKE